MLRIQIKDPGGHLVHQSLLGGRPVTLGRDPQSTVSLPEINISRNHAIIEPQGNFHRLKDLGSTNGTWVNGKPVESHLLQSGDRVTIGGYLVQVDEISESGQDFKEKSETHILDSLFDYDDSPESEHTLRLTVGEGMSTLAGSESPRIDRLQEICQELAHVETPEILYRKVLVSALEECKAERAAFLRPSDAGGIEVIQALEGPSDRGDEPFSIHRGVIETVEREQVAVLTEDASLDRRFREDPGQGDRVFSVMAVPLRSRDSLLGALYVDRVENAQPFRKGDLGFLILLANQVAASLSNALLFRDVLEEKRRVQAICDNLYDGLVITDASLGIERFNVQATRLLDEPGTNLAGKNFEEFLLKLDAGFQPETLRTALRDRDSFKLLFHRDDRPRFYHISVSPFPLGEDREPGHLFSIRDSTGLVDLENLKMDFIQAASHKLRTPLTVVLGNLEILRLDARQQPEVEAVVGESLDTMDRNLQKLQGLVDRFIEFAELDPTLEENAEVDLLEALHLAWGGLTHLASERGISLDLAVETGRTHLVRGSADLLTQCFQHLLDNALKFSPEGTRIRVALGHDDDDVVVMVADEGAGIPDEKWKYIYTGFHQGEDQITGEIPGAGLGLTIARRILQLHRAEIEGVSPDPDTGAGTRFTVRFHARECQQLPSVFLETDQIPDLVL